MVKKLSYNSFGDTIAAKRQMVFPLPVPPGKGKEKHNLCALCASVVKICFRIPHSDFRIDYYFP